MKKSNPTVSVIMPVHNAGDFLVEALDSILTQTYQDFEFIIVDDASTDSSPSILQSYAKKYPTIHLFRNNTKRGISESVKKAISKSTGKYLARMDADDISLPNRLQQQLEYLENNPHTVAVGGQCLLINEQKKIIGKKLFPTRFEDIYRYIFEFVPLQQPTLMIAKHKLPNDFEYYQDGMNTAEEVELIFKLFSYGKVENLPNYVLLYRFHSHNTSFKNIRLTFLLTLISRLKAVVKHGYVPTPKGIVITFAQTILILALPQWATLALYKFVRKTLMHKTFIAYKLPAVLPHSLATKGIL